MDPAKMKVVDLRSELGALGLDTKGNKPALVERLKKALESKTGKLLPDTSILDTTTEDDDPGTPRRAAPRTRRRSSSSRTAATPAKVAKREEPPAPIEESPERQPQQESDYESAAEEPAQKPIAATKPVSVPEPVAISEPMEVPEPEPVAVPEPVSVPEPVGVPKPVGVPEPAIADEPMKASDDKYSPDNSDSNDNDNNGRYSPSAEDDQETEKESKPSAEVSQPDQNKDDAKPQDGAVEVKQEPPKELTEEEEWAQMNERLKKREEERKERERAIAEEDAQRLKELSDDPVKLNRLKRKQEKKQRWSNFYKSVEITNEVLAPVVEEPPPPAAGKKKAGAQHEPQKKVEEPALDDDAVTLSWYDSDLNQHLSAPELTSCVPLSEGALAHAWAGARASHGVAEGKVCFEVRMGDILTTTEENVTSGLRIGWSTDDSSLHLGSGEFSWAFENSGRAVHNGEFKEYGSKFQEKDVVGAYLDLESSPGSVWFTLNGAPLGAAYSVDAEALGGRALFPHVLTKNVCYKVNFGQERYNLITKTKIVRNRIEIPVEQVLEEKRVREAELKRQKEEAERIERERREAEKLEREERNRKRKEERDRQEKERREKREAERAAAAEKKDGEDKAEDEGKTEDKTEDGLKKEDEEKQESEVKKEEPMEQDETPKENGENPSEGEEKKDQAEAKTESMETEQAGKDGAEAGEAGAGAGEAGAGEAAAEVTEEQVLGGHVLDKRIKFVIRYTVSEEIDGAEREMEAGYTLIAKARSLVPGPRRPELKDCEVILMVGLPSAGKTHWAAARCAERPQLRYNVISTGALIQQMQVDCKPFRETFEGRWDAFVTKSAKCVVKLLELARGRRRNFILDQTNVYPSAQKRKMRDFEGYRRIAVVVVPAADTYAERSQAREQSEGKAVPDGAVMDMKANFTLPEKCAWIEEVIYAELPEEEAKKVVEEFHKEAKAAGVHREKEKRERSLTQEGPGGKRPRSDDRRHSRGDDRRRDQRSGDRWGGGGAGGGGGGSRWGRDNSRGRDGGGGGGRWGAPRDRPHNQRFGGPPPGPDRWNNRGGDFNNRDMFRGGRGGGGGGGGGGRGEGRPDQRFGRSMDRQDNKPRMNQGGGGGAGSWQRGGQMMGSGGGAGAGGGGRGARGGGPGGHAGRPQGKDNNQGQSQQWNPQQQQQWGQWGNWNNWNQNQQAWGNWNNQWANWNQQQQQQQQGNQSGASTGAAAKTGAGAGAGWGAAGAGAGAGAGGQWPANYQQQWYQWQQWQQQQQQYGQGAAGATTGATGAAGAAGATPTAEQQQQMWAQYYQNYGNAANAAAVGNTADKK